MSERFDPKPKGFGDVLGIYEKRKVVVPEFQRGYSWHTNHVTAFWQDILAFHEKKAEAGAKYFMGPIVIQEKGSEIILLDGQQRLATATILFSVLRGFAVKADTEEGKFLARDIQKDLIGKRGGGYSLTLNKSDADYFRDVIQKEVPVEAKARVRSNLNILKARKQIEREVEKLLEGTTPEERVKWLQELKDTVESSVAMVAISVNSEDDAYMIFETLNDRGLRLSTPDLLLNFLMGKAGSEEERKEIRGKWDGMLARMEDRDLGEFFRHMWLSKYGDVKAHALFREIREHIVAGKIKSVDFIASCDKECDLYVGILGLDKKVLGDSHKHVTALVKDLQISTSYPLLLAAKSCLDAGNFEKLVRQMTALVVRYLLLADLNPGTLENEFYALARMLRNMQATNETQSRRIDYAMAQLSKLNPPDDLVIKGAEELYLDRKSARYIVPAIARALQSKTKEVGIDEANLEHIFPQSPTEAEWPNLDDLKAHVWHLGNLTMLGVKLNRDAANKGYKIKADTYYKVSELVMPQNVASKFAAWDFASIVAHAKSLGTLFVEVWPGPKAS